MIKVLNIASFIPVEGLPFENDISLKIYAELRIKFGIQSEFIKPVGNIPSWATYLKKSLRIRKLIFNQQEYFDKRYNIKINFYKGTLPFVNRLPFNIKYFLPLQFFFYGKQLFNIIFKIKPDLIHAHSIYPDGYYALEIFRKYNIPYFITLRGRYTKFYDTKIGKEILKNAKILTTPSYYLCKEISGKYKIRLIPHGIDEVWFEKVKKEFHKGEFNIVTTCRLLKMKNIHVILKAISKLIEEGYTITYDIIGDGDFRYELEKLTKSLGLGNIVRFHGYQEANYIREIYKKSNIFIMLSYPETYGRSYFEAAAQGLYIIGVKNTGAYGHLNEEDGSFIDIDDLQLIEELKKLNKEIFLKKTESAQAKIKDYRNIKILEQYFNLLNGFIVRKV